MDNSEEQRLTEKSQEPLHWKLCQAGISIFLGWMWQFLIYKKTKGAFFYFVHFHQEECLEMFFKDFFIAPVFWQYSIIVPMLRCSHILKIKYLQLSAYFITEHSLVMCSGLNLSPPPTYKAGWLMEIVLLGPQGGTGGGGVSQKMLENKPNIGRGL